VRPDGRYRVAGDMKKYFWHESGQCRYELGELDEVMPELRLRDDEPFLVLPGSEG
jgi:hypothetical protein